MPRKTSAALKGMLEAERLKKLDRCRRDSWYLATEVLGYGFNEKLGLGLTERIHRPLCAYYDRNRHDPFVGIWMRRKLGHKSTLVCTWIIQEMLIDPCVTQGYFHAIDENAQMMVAEVGNHIMQNDDLRALDPIGYDPKKDASYDAFPMKRYAKKAVTSTRVTLRRHRFDRSPSLYGKGAGAEVTGVHFTGPVWLDDIIGEKTILNSQLGVIERWVQGTIMNVWGGRARSTGTMWAEESVHQKWIESSDWRSLVIPGAVEESDEEFLAALERNDKKIRFAPCYKFTNPMFWPADWKSRAKKRLKMEQEAQKGDFSPQIMNDAEPEHEKPWSRGYENTTGRGKTASEPGIGGPGQVFVLSDPAPFLGGSYKGIGEKVRADGTKDYWSICAVKLRVRGPIMDVILLDGVRSLEWAAPDGATEAARLMYKYGATKFFSENPKEHHPYMVSACLSENVRLTRGRDGGPLKFDDYNKADGKNSRIIQLAAKARDMEFWICTESCRPSFLYGDGVHTGFLTQIRKFRKVAQGKNNLRFDDDVDVVSRALDTALLEFAPKPHILEAVRPYSPYRDNSPQEEELRAFGKHIRV